MCCFSRRRRGTSSVRKRFDSAASFFNSISVLGKVRSCITVVLSRIQTCRLLDISRYSWYLRCASYKSAGSARKKHRQTVKNNGNSGVSIMIYRVVERVESWWFRKHVVKRGNVRNKRLLIRFGGINICNWSS